MTPDCLAICVGNDELDVHTGKLTAVDELWERHESIPSHSANRRYKFLLVEYMNVDRPKEAKKDMMSDEVRSAPVATHNPDTVVPLVMNLGDHCWADRLPEILMLDKNDQRCRRSCSGHSNTQWFPTDSSKRQCRVGTN